MARFKRPIPTTCTCGAPRMKGQSCCHACRAQYMRGWRARRAEVYRAGLEALKREGATIEMNRIFDKIKETSPLYKAIHAENEENHD